MKFTDLNFHPTIQSGIDQLGFTECTPVQEATMPHIIEGRDVAGLAQTGTGKTAAFLLPIMERIVRARLNPDQLSDAEKELRQQRAFTDWRPNQFVLVLVPTRELADQVQDNAAKFSRDSNLRTASIYGGVAYDKQKEALRQGVEFIIATPGRLIDLYEENLVDLKQVRAVVFDEADRMFDMGFKDDMKFILQRIPKERQFLVFSATLNLDVLNTAYQFGAQPVEVNVSRDKATAENVEDKIFHVGQEEKGSHLLSLLRLHKPRQAIVFSNFKMNVPRITQFLNDNGLPTVGISSLLTQSQRNRVMEQFKGESDHNILVATDVAARGLDIKGVDMVINFELPDDPENYVHRIGRTGRAGAKGIAVSLVSDRDVDALTRVEQYLKHKIDTGFLEEAELVKEYRAMPSAGREGRGSDRGSGGRGGSDRGPRSGSRDRSRGDRKGAPGSGRGGESRRPEARSEGRPDARRPDSRRPQGSQDDQRRSAKGPGGRRDHSRPQQQGQGAQAGQGSDQKRRDQRPGRFGQNGQNRPDARRGGPQQGGAHSSRPGGRRNDRQGSGSRPGQGAPPQSLGQKVSGFFKRIFGAE